MSLFDMALDAQESAELAKAIFIYTQATKMDSWFSETYYNSANAYLKLKRCLDAAANFKKAIALNPDKSRIYNDAPSWTTAAGLCPGLTSFKIERYRMEVIMPAIFSPRG